MSEEARRRLVALALLAGLAFGYPVLVLVESLGRCCLPAAVPVWMFLAWAVVSLLAWQIAANDRKAR